MDRNTGILAHHARKIVSLSARRAWIEIIFPPVDTSSVRVALRKESVDRNIKKQEQAAKEYRRSPQGERG